MYKLSLCLLACIVVVINAEPGCPCSSDFECDFGECCEILNMNNMIASKRRVAYNSNSGTCQLRIQQGGYCDYFDEMNGYCGCGPGMWCHTRTEPTCEANFGKRAMAADTPGYSWVSTCEYEGA